MSICKVIRQHRKKNALTQKDLAKILGVSLMTVSRLESEHLATLSNPMVAKLDDLFDEQDFKGLDPNNPVDEKLLSYHSNRLRFDRNENKMSERDDIALVFSSVEVLLSHIDFHNHNEMVDEALMELQNKYNDYEIYDIFFYPDTAISVFPYERVYTDRCSLWLISTIFTQSSETAKKHFSSEYIRSTISNLLYRYIGFTDVHADTKKISFCVPDRMLGIVSSEMHSMMKLINELRCDLSILGYRITSDTCVVFSEIDVLFHGNERGLFDIDHSYDKDILRKWKSALFFNPNDSTDNASLEE